MYESEPIFKAIAAMQTIKESHASQSRYIDTILGELEQFAIENSEGEILTIADHLSEKQANSTSTHLN